MNRCFALINSLCPHLNSCRVEDLMNAVAGEAVVIIVGACLVTTSIVNNNSIWCVIDVLQSLCTLICILLMYHSSCSLIFVSKDTRNQWRKKTDSYLMLRLVFLLHNFFLH